MIEGNLVDFNQRSGIYVDDGSATIGPDNRLLDDLVGLWLSRDADVVRVVGNRLVDNTNDAVHLTAALETLTIEGNLLAASGKAAFSTTTDGQADRFLGLNDLQGNEAETRVRG